MDHRQHRQLQAARRANRILLNYQSEWASIPGFVRQHNIVSEMLEEIDELEKAQAGDSRGVTLGKEAVRQEVIDRAVILAGMTHVWAFEQGDHKLEQATDIVPSHLKDLHSRLPARARIILDAARVALAQGGKDFGMTEDDLNIFEERILRLEDRVIAPRVFLAEGKTVTNLLAERIVALMDQFSRRIDRLMRQFERSNASFYRDYTHARYIGKSRRRRGGRDDGDAAFDREIEMDADAWDDGVPAAGGTLQRDAAGGIAAVAAVADGSVPGGKPAMNGDGTELSA